MMPVNSKSLFAHLCVQMEKLDKAEIDASTAQAQSSLVGQAVNILNYELKRAIVLSDNRYVENVRNVESKNFDSLPMKGGKLIENENEN